MAALFARIKVWGVNETVTSTDLNAEFNNILNNLAPAGISGASVTIPDMQEVFDPGNIGSENQPESLKEEIQALRSMIQKITGETQWYVPPGTSLNTLEASVSISQNNRVNSGFINADEFPAFLSITGASLALTVLADSTSLSYNIDGVSYLLNEDVGRLLAAGPSSDNTALINDAVNAGERSRVLGEVPGTRIGIDTVGTEIITRLNRLVAFKYAFDGDEEISIGTLRQEGGDYYIEECFRGYFFDNLGNTVRAKIEDDETITMLRLNYIYLNTTGGVLASAKDPFIQGPTPSAPVLGDYWFDLNNRTWKIYDGLDFVSAESTLIGFAAVGPTAIEGIRPVDFFKPRSPVCDIGFAKISDTQVGPRSRGGYVNVDGKIANFDFARPVWDITTDLDAGETEAATTYYYCYLTEGLTTVISSVRPYNRQYDLKGWYHPYKNWRCVGGFFNGTTSNIENVESFGSDSYIADNSIGKEKIRNSFIVPQAGFTNPFTIPRVSNSPTFSTTVTANSIPVGLVTSGKPVMLGIYFGPGGSGIGGTGTGTLAFAYRRLPDDTWTQIGAPVAISGVSFPSITQLAFLPAGQYEFRAEYVYTSGTHGIVGDFIAVEL